MRQAGPFGEDRLTTIKEMIPTGVCERMIISVASGKGGTGKTTIATSLAAVLGSRAQLLDCDVEEPNCHILMKPVLQTCESITIPVPIVDMDKCTLCGKCGEVCRFSAIVVIGDQVLTFPEMCHGCGGCALLCPERAIREGSRELGVRETGFAGPVEFVQGRLRIGEAMSPPLIRAVKEKINPRQGGDPRRSSRCFLSGDQHSYGVGFHHSRHGTHSFRTARLENCSRRDLSSRNPSRRDSEPLRRGRRRGTEVLCCRRAYLCWQRYPTIGQIAEGYAMGDLLVVSAPEYIKTFPWTLRARFRQLICQTESGLKEAMS